MLNRPNDATADKWGAVGKLIPLKQLKMPHGKNTHIPLGNCMHPQISLFISG